MPSIHGNHYHDHLHQVAHPIDVHGGPSKSTAHDIHHHGKFEKAEAHPAVRLLSSDEYITLKDCSNAVWNQLLDADNSLRNDIEKFRHDHSEKMQVLNQCSWKDLKTKETTGMVIPRDSDNISYEEFRILANAFIEKCCHKAAVKMGLPEVKWTACGTPGYNSDVDVAMEPVERNGIKRELTLNDSYVNKYLRDAAHNFIFGGLSGTQLDTESYPAHGAIRKTLEKLNGKEAISHFISSEMSMALTQTKLVTSSHQKDWNEFCFEELDGIDDSEVRSSTSAIMKGIDDWHSAMHIEILKQVIIEDIGKVEETPQQIKVALDLTELPLIEEQANKICQGDSEAYKRAAINYRRPIILRLAKTSEELTHQIAKIEKKLQTLNHVDPLSPMYHRYEALMVRFDICAKMLASLLDEGTLSQSEGLATLYSKEGQIDVSNTKRMLKDMKKLSRQSLFEATQLIEEADFVKVSDTLSTIKTKMSTLVEARPKMNSSNMITNTIAAFEQVQQYRHIIHDGLKKAEGKHNGDEIACKALIDGGKYHLRAIGNIFNAMEQYKMELEQQGQPLDDSFSYLFEAMKTEKHKAAELEHAKRKFKFNRTAAIQLLSEAIIANKIKVQGVKEKNIDKSKIDEDLSEIMDEFDKGGRLSDIKLIKRNKMSIIIGDLISKGYISDDMISSESTSDPLLGTKIKLSDERFNTILRGIVGYKREKQKNLNEMFREADTILLSHYNVQNVDDVQSSLKYTESLCRKWQNMAFEKGILPKLSSPSWINENMNYLKMWNVAKKQIADDKS